MFKQLCVDYVKLLSSFTEDEGQVYLFLLLNFGAILYRRGHYEIIQSVLLMQKSGLTSGLIYQNKNLDQNMFFSICSSFCECGLFEEGSEFIAKHEKRITPKTNEYEAFQLGKAVILFNQTLKKGDKNLLNKTIKDLLNICFSTPEYIFRIKSMQLRLYYEMFIQSADSQCFIENFTIAFERQIIRNDTLNYKKESFLNLVKITKKLIYYHSKPSQRLKEEINNKFNIHSGVGKRWLSEKIRELP